MFQMFVGVVALVGLLAVWVAVQWLQRRQTPGMANDADVLACRMCDGNGACSCGLRSALGRRSPKRVGE